MINNLYIIISKIVFLKVPTMVYILLSMIHIVDEKRNRVSLVGRSLDCLWSCVQIPL